MHLVPDVAGTLMCFCTPPILLRSLLLWSGSDQNERTRRRRWLGSRPIPAVVLHVSHVSSVLLGSAAQESSCAPVRAPARGPAWCHCSTRTHFKVSVCAALHGSGRGLLSWSLQSVQLLASHQGLWLFDPWSLPWRSGALCFCSSWQAGRSLLLFFTSELRIKNRLKPWITKKMGIIFMRWFVKLGDLQQIFTYMYIFHLS